MSLYELLNTARHVPLLDVLALVAEDVDYRLLCLCLQCRTTLVANIILALLLLSMIPEFMRYIAIATG